LVPTLGRRAFHDGRGRKRFAGKANGRAASDNVKGEEKHVKLRKNKIVVANRGDTAAEEQGGDGTQQNPQMPAVLPSSGQEVEEVFSAIVIVIIGSDDDHCWNGSEITSTVYSSFPFPPAAAVTLFGKPPPLQLPFVVHLWCVGAAVAAVSILIVSTSASTQTGAGFLVLWESVESLKYWIKS
jgi:hypothetical protein